MKHAALCLVLFFTMKCFSIQVDCSEEQIDSLLRSYIYVDDIQDEKILANLKMLHSLGYKKFPALYSLYQKNSSDERYTDGILTLFLNTDGANLASRGDPEALEITRDVLKKRGKRFCLPAVIYLAKKGTGVDIDALRELTNVERPYFRQWAQKMLFVLESRVAGTNLIDGIQTGVGVQNISQTKPGFIPSVANTGPQAELVFQRIREELMKVNGDVKKLPPELLTLTIPPPQPVVERFKEKSWLIGAGILLLAGIGVLMFRKTKKP